MDAHGGEVTVVSMGPAGVVDSLRKALAMGAHRAVHVLDEGLAGSCAVQTSAVLAAAIGSVGADVVIAGNESTDGVVGAMGAMLAERLGWPQLTSMLLVSRRNQTRMLKRKSFEVSAPTGQMSTVFSE